MNLIACDNCAVVFDKHKIVFPDIFDKENGDLLRENAVWTSNGWVAKIICPVCGEEIGDNTE
jgi:hypothetical protein